MKYVDHLIAIACERATESTEVSSITNPTNFFQALYLYAARSNIPITREGTDKMMDILFSHPDMQPLLEPTAATKFQNDFATLYLPSLSLPYRSFWTYIVLPAWGQHLKIQQLLRQHTG